jgi:cytochrome c553
MSPVVSFQVGKEKSMSLHGRIRPILAAGLLPVVALLGLSACAQDDEPPSPEEVTAHMAEHFSRASDLQRAVVNGDMDAVREAANWLADHSKMSGAPTSWDPYLEEMRTAADVAAGSEDLYTAAKATARVGAACGDCHKAHGAKVRFDIEGALAEGGDAIAHMKRHVWASARLWEGLVVPSAEVWQTGAQALDEVPLVPEEFTDDTELMAEVGVTANKVHELGAAARQALEPSTRAATYGEMLATCSRCHTATGAGRI